MIRWLHITLIAVSAGILTLVLLLILKKCFLRKNHKRLDPERDRSLQNGIARLHQVSPAHHHHHKDKPAAALFSWADHPSYVTEAVENGWSRFAFTTFISSSPPPSSTRSLLGSCGGGDRTTGVETNIEIGWEVCEGSADFMQKIRFINPNTVKSTTGAVGPVSAVRGALPLPGPNLGNSSFPQEAYFEVTILSCNENVEYDHDELGELKGKKGKLEGDKIKLIGEDINAKNSGSQRSSSKIEEAAVVKINGKKQCVRNEGVSLCVGLIGGEGGGTLPMRFPGSFLGSIGFDSTGSVYLDGTKLVFESETKEWGGIPDKVVGCGYNPSQKKVFFTVDSQLAHEIYCKSIEFSSPLYPTIASDADTTVLVNLGQSPFRFAPANLQRTRNPCFIGGHLSTSSPALSYDEDSKELFSMGRIDSHWQQRSANRSNNNTVNSIRDIDYDQESEGDLFEIVLDSSGRSPYTTLHQ